MNYMKYNGGMTIHRKIDPPKPMRQVRQTLRRNSVSRESNVNIDTVKHGYIVIGTRKLSIYKSEAGRTIIPKDAQLITSAPQSVELNHKFIEELFREARNGKFDTFSCRLREIINQFSTPASTDQDQSTLETVSETSVDPLAAARQRGLQYAFSEWQKPENLTLQTAARYAGVSDSTINSRRQNQQIYALVAPGRSRGFRYPHWQFDIDPERLQAAIQAFTDAGRDNYWLLHNFFKLAAAELDDVRPCDYLADPSKDIKRLLQVIQYQFTIGDQGAS